MIYLPFIVIDVLTRKMIYVILYASIGVYSASIPMLLALTYKSTRSATNKIAPVSPMASVVATSAGGSSTALEFVHVKDEMNKKSEGRCIAESISRRSVGLFSYDVEESDEDG